MTEDILANWLFKYRIHYVRLEPLLLKHFLRAIANSKHAHCIQLHIIVCLSAPLLFSSDFLNLLDPLILGLLLGYYKLIPVISILEQLEAI